MNTRPMLAKVHIAKAQLCLDDDTYQDIVRRITGRESSAGCTPHQLELLLAEFRRLGWQPKAKKVHASPPRVRKVWALWGAMCREGLVRADGAAARRTALRAFVLRMTGVGDPEWLTPAQASQVIEGLKSWKARGAQ